METDTALVRTNGHVVLYTVSHVCLYVALVINPRYTECEDSVWNTESLNKISFLKLWVLVVNVLYRLKHLLYCLKIFRFIWKSFLKAFYYVFSVHN